MAMGVADACRTEWVQDPIDFEWICKHPFPQLAHHSRTKGHFVRIFDTVRSRSV